MSFTQNYLQAPINGSNVTYSFVTTPVSSSAGGFTVSYGTPGDGARAEVTTPRNSDGTTLGANATLDTRMTNPAAILETMVHEIGHPAGFGHCSGCPAEDSVMSTVPYTPNDGPSMNQTYGRPTIPTQCDNQKLKTSLYTPCNTQEEFECVNAGLLWNSADCSCDFHNHNGGGGGGGGSGGGGGGPIYPDLGSYCTPYYWVNYISYDGGKTWQFDYIDSYAGCW